MTKNTIWITGAAGKLGAALVERLSANVENKVIATDRDVDITNTTEVMQHVDVYRPTIIINCASISGVEYCEANEVEAYKVNALGARNLATAARHVNAKMIQLSTDDVFAGNETGAKNEFDTPVPTTVYGKSKLAGENYVRELTPKHLIVRSSWVYGLGNDDFFSYVSENGKNNTAIEVSKNNFGTPTSATELAKCIEAMIDKSEYGVFHASCEGLCSRAQFAKAILKKQGYDESLVIEMDSEKVSTVLENLMMKMTEIYEMADWESCLDAYINELK